MTSIGWIESIRLHSTVGSVILAFVTYFLVWKLWSKRLANSPPGSNGIPFLGVVLSLRTYPERVMQQWTKKYGPLCMVKFGNTNVVLLGTADVAYEAFAKYDCFIDRPLSMPMFDGNGLLFVKYSDFLKEQRRFGLHTLREFGMGKRSLEPQILEVMNNLCNSVNTICGKDETSPPFDIIPLLYESSSSVICHIVFGRNLAAENKNLQLLLEDLWGHKKTNVLFGILMFAPNLRYFPFFSYVWKNGITYREKFAVEMKKEMKNHQLTHDPNHPRDYMDSFITQMKKRVKASANNAKDKKTIDGEQFGQESLLSTSSFDERETDFSSDWEPLSSFTMDQIAGSLRDLFLAGTETSATSLTWIIYYLCKYPNVQRKMQQEIDNCLGENGIPSTSVMEKLPYVRSVIQEALRIRPPAPLSVPHLASKDSVLRGYRIPKGAIILTNIWGIHHDSSNWFDPEKFSPERHLDDEGKFVKSSNWMPFGVGARSCLGVQLANMEVYLATVTLFRRFNLSFAPGQKVNLNGESMVTLRPLTHLLNARKR